MNRILETQPDLNYGYNCGALIHYDCTLFNLELPNFEVTKQIGSIQIDLDPASHSAVSTVGSTLETRMTITDNKLCNIVHDITVGHLTPITDCMFCSVFEVKGDGFDNHSPDMILETGPDSYYVIEFTTNRGGEQSARTAALNKIAKYEIPCQNRSSGVSIKLGVISVHRDGVWSNMNLGDEDVNELVYRYRLALDVFSDISIRCPDLLDEDGDSQKTKRELNGIISLISMDWERTESAFPMFKKEVIESFGGYSSDSDYISRIVSKSLKECHDDLIKSSFFDENLTHEERLMRNLQDCEDKISTYREEYMKSDLMREINDSKSTIQIPGWVTSEGPEGKNLKGLGDFSISGSHPMCKIWDRVCRCAATEEIERMYDDPDAELEFAMSDQRERSDERNKYHRVRLDISREEEDYIATLGVCAKSKRDNHQVELSRLRSKKAFSLNHDISALEEFLNTRDRSVFEPSEETYCPLLQDLELRAESMTIHQPRLFTEKGTNEFLENYISFMKSPLGSWSQMVSLIGAELSASVKQHVKHSSYVVKRLLNSSVYLLIKPTNSKSHIFVSFAVEKDRLIANLDNSTVFKQCIDGGDILITDFVSYKLSKLTNLCKTSSLLYCALCFWTETHCFSPWDSVKVAYNERSPGGHEVRFMTKLSLLTLLEDKATTEELQTMLRYVIMEGFVSQPEIPKPQKMMSKLPTIMRSELQVFLLTRVFLTMRRISSKPFLLIKNGSRISWSQLFNPFTQSSVRDVQPVINCCYNGYFKNKEEETEPSVLSKMYKKIIELEDCCPKDDMYLGMGDPEDPKMHEFSRSYLKECVDHAKQLLSRIHGQNFMQMIEDQIVREVSQITLERLATLKATSNFNNGWYNYKEVKDKNYTRDKLIVKMSQFANEGSSLAIQKFEECMTRIEEKKCMEICLFKKQQHGGLREIYVMGADERIVQSIVECISKTIGKFFPSDTLCNPSNKTKIPETHGMRARKHCEGSVWTCSTSDDARKWNQGHFVTKFAMMLRSFTTPKWWPIITRGCSMFTRKNMMMNLSFMRILDCHTELKTSDEFSTTLFKAYHGEITVPWFHPGCTYLTTKTGMMQGILHFTSSLLHTIHQEYIRSLSFKIFNSKVHPEMSYKMVCDMMQGSDDSSMMISFPSKDESLIAKCKVAAALCFRMKKKLGIYLGIYPSEKSTSNTDFVMEYNSEFYFHSQHVRPTIRWIAASCSLPEVETLVARQEEASNLLTSVTEGGGSFSLAACIQHSQCLLHYMLMGMGVSELFKEYSKAIVRWKDPGLGFFLFDNPYAAGLPGFRYNLYKVVTTTNLQKIYAHFLKKVRSREEDDALIPETCSVSPGGALILSSALKWGSRQKFLKLRSRLHIPDDWVEQINEHPSVLYRAPSTGNEIILRIAEKVHSPGVVSSLSSGNAVAKVMASSVYFLSAAIFEDAGRPEYSFTGDQKYSLLHKMALYNGFSGYGDIDDEDILFLFPNVSEYQQLDSIIYNKSNIEFIVRINQRENTQTKITIFDQHSSLKISPEKLVSDKWFGTQKSKIGLTALDNEWHKLKTIVGWLRDTPEQTLENSPFRSHVQIRNFFARMEVKPRSVRITGAPVKKRSGISKLSLVIRDNYARNGYLKGIEDIEGVERSNAAEVAKHFLFGILAGPYNTETKEQLVIKSLSILPEVSLKESDRKTKSNLISILQNWCSGNGGTSQLIEEVGAGIIGGFVLPQKCKINNGKVEYYGEGIWRGFMDGCQTQIEIYNSIGLPPHIRSITVTDKSSIWELSAALRSWCEDIGAFNGVDYSKTASKKGLKYWMHDFKPYGLDKPFGVPVYVVRGDMVKEFDVSEDQIRLKVRRSTINLYVKESNRDIHILSYTAGDNDLSPVAVNRTRSQQVKAALELFSKEPSSSWMRCSSIPIMFINKLLEISESKLNIGTLDSDRLRHIMKTCTESSLRSRVGNVFQNVPGSSDAPQVFDLDSVINIMIEDMAGDMFTSIAKDIEVDLQEAYSNEEFDFTDIDLFGPAHFKEVTDLTMISHPLMDEFIDFLISNVGRKKIRKALQTLRCARRDMILLKQLLRCLCMDPNSLREEYQLEDIECEVDDDMIG
ncbi:RNA-dependent RNA polymerase [Cacao virus]|uniref:RNA-directed RNA polymerase L n=1 Tax=Cacao virus TaxID=629730 RepID=A0A4P8D7R8_9VIRU|nr:RNA-dependent RNA polymerase [Cacao virus]QCI62731.1 RNA-dependent RNA polymerase [Cacao virus]QLA46864.1 L [Cacao virus] [Cacao virus]